MCAARFMDKESQYVKRGVKAGLGMSSLVLALVASGELLAQPAPGAKAPFAAVAPGQGAGGQLPGAGAASPASSALSANAANAVIGVVDIGYIYKNHLFFKSQMEAMQKDAEAVKQQLKDEAEGIQKMMEQLKSYNVGTPEYKQTEQAIMQRQANFQTQGSLKEKDFMEREAQLYYRVYKDIQAAVGAYARTANLQMVLRYNRDEPDAVNRQAWVSEINRTVIWHNQVDISDILLQQLNRAAGMPPQTARQPAGNPAAPVRKR